MCFFNETYILQFQHSKVSKKRYEQIDKLINEETFPKT